MNDEIIKIITRLKDGEISVDNAIASINNIKQVQELDTAIQNINIKKAKKIKIYVNDKSSGQLIKIPGIPLKLVSVVSSFGLKMAKKYSDDLPKNLDINEWKKMFEVLSDMGAMEVADIDTPEAQVHIYTY